MSIPAEIQAAIGDVHDQESFIQRLLVETLEWDIDPDISQVEDTAYEYTTEDLNCPLLDEKCDGRALRIAFQHETSWGIFLLEFAHEEPFIQSRGLTMLLRQLLNCLVPKQRRRSDLPSWGSENLLFICTYDYRHFRFAYFQAPPGKEKTAPLKVFGWNEGDMAIRTLCDHNLPHLHWDNNENWAEAFDIEKVTAEFYEEYKEIFKRVEDAVAFSCDVMPNDRRLFTQTLFNRLMFLRFIERKDWLKFGDTRDYLGNLYVAGGIGSKSFYQSRLVPLFFEALAMENQQECEAIGRVPFLNGGLFERTAIDDQVDDIPDEAFRDILALPTQSHGGGLFYRYNFTISESTPLDIEVAVDPEMLGKVFEELVTGRHESGSYYTPRPVVAFMCREALKGYLAERTAVPEDSIARLVDEHDPCGVLEGQRQSIEHALDNIRACDPACGSGAYLLGLMQELIAVRRALQSEKLKADSKFLYALKLRIISHNLYGVDIDPFATNIAMLRLWLSLSVEADAPEPLPNLDFKIETGDSLLGPCREFQKDFSSFLLERRSEHLVEKKDEFLRAHGRKKDRLYEYICKEEDEIAEECRVRHGKGVIAWPVQFAEVFFRQRKEANSPPAGFDIILANPPYGIRTSCHHSRRVSNTDSYACFIGLARELTAGHGHCAYIVPTSWETGERFSAFRKWLLHHNKLCTVVNLPYDVFEVPYVDTCIVCFCGTSTEHDSEIRIATLPKRSEGGTNDIAGQLTPLRAEQVCADSEYRLLLEPQAAILLGRMARYDTLNDHFDAKRGIEAYRYDIASTRRSKTWHPYFTGQIYRYVVEARDSRFVKAETADLPWGTGPRLLLRRIVNRQNRLMASLVSESFIVKKDLYVIRAKGKKRQEEMLLYLLGLLNSSLFSYVYLVRSASAQKDDYRQVTLQGIRGLPFLYDDTLAKEVIHRTRRLLALGRDTEDWQGEDMAVDQLVYRVFGVLRDEQLAIEAYLSQRG